MSIKNHVLLLVGDQNVGKTTSLQGLLDSEFEPTKVIESDISLFNFVYNSEDTSNKENQENYIPNLEDEIQVTIWDARGTITGLNYFILPNQIQTCLIFCNLQNAVSCSRLDYWKELVEKSCEQEIQFVVVGTMLIDKTSHRKINTRLLERCKIEVLEWCVENGDIPSFCIDLNNQEDICKMYQTIFLNETDESEEDSIETKELVFNNVGEQEIRYKNIERRWSMY